jgi:hypothetical protein
MTLILTWLSFRCGTKGGRRWLLLWEHFLLSFSVFVIELVWLFHRDDVGEVGDGGHLS